MDTSRSPDLPPDPPAIHLEIVADRYYPADYAWLRVFGDVEIDPDSPEIIIQRSGDRHYLRQAGWSELPGGVAVLDTVAQNGVTDLLLGAEPFARIDAGAEVLVSLPALDVEQRIIWPAVFAGASGTGEDGGGDLPFDDVARSDSAVPVTGPAGEGEAREGPPEDDRAPARAPLRGRRRHGGGRQDRNRTWRSTRISAREDSLPVRRRDGEETPAPSARPRRRVALPWKITAFNLVLIALVAFTGIQMSTGGFNPFALFGSETGEQTAGGPSGPETLDYDAYQRAALDALAAIPAATGDGTPDPLAGLRAETDGLIRAGAAASEITGAARAFLAAGRPVVALYLLELAYSRGSGEAALAIGRMSDPRLFSPATSGFTRPNAELAITWYRRAVEAGAVAAIIELDDLRLDLEAAAAAGDLDAANALLLFD